LLELKSHSVRRNNLRYIDFLVPGIIAMTLMNSAMFGLAGTIVNYRERGILRRLKVTPQPLPVFLSAQIVNQLFFAIIRALLLVGVARLLFGVHVMGSYLVLLAVVVVGSLCFVTIAFTVASFAKNREIADSLSNIVSMPMMFLSGVFFPMDNAPSWIQPIIKTLPLKYLADATRAVMIKGEGLASISLDLEILLGVTVAFFIASVFMWRWE
jgi:ABC-2 type transport system permease protein